MTGSIANFFLSGTGGDLMRLRDNIYFGAVPARVGIYFILFGACAGSCRLNFIFVVRVLVGCGYFFFK